MRGYPKTSGSRGIHILVRIEPRWPFEDARRAALAVGRELERVGDALGCRDPGHLEERITRDDNVVAAVKRLADGLERAAAHDDGLAHGEAAKRLEIGGEPPGQTAVFADDAVFSHGHDKGENQFSTKPSASEMQSDRV